MMNGMPLELVPPDRIESPAYEQQDAIVGDVERFLAALHEIGGGTVAQGRIASAFADALLRRTTTTAREQLPP